ncbi:MAG TPA: DUF2252 family protein, partial [Acidobacteriaceae bacterium]
MPTEWTTPQARRQSGQAIRKETPRRLHANFSAKARTTPALTLLEQSVKGRIPALVKIKNERMAVSPFGYFRGAVPVMAADLAALPSTGILVQLCGDAHVHNLGAYMAEDGRLIFDINDFDETFRGPFEWDIKRLAASIVVAGRQASGKELLCERAVQRFIGSYSERMRVYASMSYLDVARDQIARYDEVTPVHAALQKAVRVTPMRTLKELTLPASKAEHAESAALSKNGEADSASSRLFREQKPLQFHLDSGEAH